jgi:thymidylate synthase (FAD)
MDLHNLFHFLELRMDPHAHGIQEYARAIATLAKAVAPLAYAAFERHQLNGRRFSAEEMEVLRGLLKGQPNPLTGIQKLDFEQKLFGAQ